MLQQEILKFVEKQDQNPDKKFTTWDITTALKEDYEKVVGVVKSLVSHSVLVATPTAEIEKCLLTKEGEECLSLGSQEYRVYSNVPSDGISADELKKKLGEDLVKIGLSNAFSRKALKMVDGKVIVIDKSFQDVTRDSLKQVKNEEAISKDAKNALTKRKLITLKVIKPEIVEKGPKFKVDWKAPYSGDLTSEMIANGSWKNQEFKPCNTDSLGLSLDCGYLHPLMKVRTEIRKVLLEMGFQEMATNRFVESSFWNFDALFQPQQHPARDAHDTFYLSSPSHSANLPEHFVAQTKLMHESGGHGSIGWRYNWDEKESQKLILRTHTTAVSSRTLYKLAQEGFKPGRYFSIDRVFRNENLDATHLAEFQQIEGFICDYDLGLVDLMGILSAFYKRIGIGDLRYKPAYNPYTEPSMEVFGYHKELGDWIEVGNSGVFRPEMLLPLGLPPNVTVIAWGLSLERPTMIKYSIKDIRDLMGYKSKINFIRENPLCRLDK